MSIDELRVYQTDRQSRLPQTSSMLIGSRLQSFSDMAITSHGKVRPTWIGTGRVPANAVSAARAV
jgi:hypothetical protein